MGAERRLRECEYEPSEGDKDPNGVYDLREISTVKFLVSSGRIPLFKRLGRDTLSYSRGRVLVIVPPSDIEPEDRWVKRIGKVGKVFQLVSSEGELRGKPLYYNLSVEEANQLRYRLIHTISPEAALFDVS